jgi:DNA-binding NtrC family response regulator
VHILLVDDDDAFRVGLAENLREDGHAVRDFSGSAAIPTEHPFAGYDVLITDFRMDGVETGLDLASQFRRELPDTPVVVVTAFADDRLDHEIEQLPGITLLGKPIDYDALHAVIRRVVGRP